jgi:hypothetical protein
MDLFIAVIKKHSFYPEGNAALEDSFKAFLDWLAAFLERHDGLRIDVEKSRFVHSGTPVQEEKPGERSVIFPLFRDGVQWFEFQAGVSENELLGFIRLINRYREYRDESENDLVTALWEADFPCIRHKAVDRFWEGEALISLSNLKVAEGEGGALDAAGMRAAVNSSTAREDPAQLLALDAASPARAGMEQDASRGASVRMFMAKLERAQSRVAGPDASPDPASIGRFWKLTPEEEKYLKDMILAEEQRNTARDSLGILLVLMEEALDDSDRGMVQEFASEEFRHLLAQGDFANARAFVERLAFMREEARPNVARLIDGIVGGIASTDVLGELNRVWEQVRPLPDAALEDLRRMLLFLPPATINVFSRMVTRVREPRARAIIMDAIAHQARRSRADVTQVVGAMSGGLICELIAGYAVRGEAAPAAMLKKFVRHRDGSVREAAAKALLAETPDDFEALFHLLEDPAPSVGRWLLAEMGKKRNPQAEHLLLDYIADDVEAGGEENEKLILECYYALGRCGSKASVGFLRDILMRKSLGAFLGYERTAHRTGAAVALSLMPAEWGAREVLREAENSHLVGIRRAHTRARMKTRKMRRDANG